jgi:hypothetical protein
MNIDRRLENLLYDSDLLRFESGPTENFVIKTPSKLSRLVREKIERAHPTPSRPIGNLLLNVNFHELEKSLETTKQSLKMEPVAIEVDLSHLSAYPTIHSILTDQLPSENKAGKIISPLEAKMELYLKYIRGKHQEEIALDSAQNIKSARRMILTGNLRDWDSRIDKVIDSTSASKDPFVYDNSKINSFHPFVIRKMDKRSDANLYRYLNHVYTFVQRVRPYEPTRPRGQASSDNNILNELDHTSGFINTTTRNIQRNGSMHYMLNQSRDSVSARGGSVHEDQFSLRSKIGNSILPRREKFTAILNLLSEFSMISQDGKERQIFLTAQELLLGLNYGAKDPNLSPKDLSIEHTNELIQRSCYILENVFNDSCKRNARRKKIEVANLGSIQIDTLQIILGYIDDFVLRPEIVPNTMIVRDDKGTPIFALLFYLLRAGLGKLFESFCEEYQDKYMDEVKQILSIYRERVHGIQQRMRREEQLKLQSDINSLAYAAPKDVFKSALLCLLGGSDEDVDQGAILSEMNDFLWFYLFKSQESLGSPSNNTLLELQRQIAFFENEEKDVIQVVKNQILTLMFAEAVQTLYQSSDYYAEAAQLAFIFEEARLIQLQALWKHRQPSLLEQSRNEEILANFADGIANKFPTEAIAYLCAINDPHRRAYAIRILFEKNGLIPLYFNTNNSSYLNLEKFKTLITQDVYDIFLNSLIDKSESDLQRLTISHVRILEEANNITAIIKLLIEIFYWEVQRMRQTDSKSKEIGNDEQIAEAKRYLTRLFSEPAIKVAFEQNENYRYAILAKNIYELIHQYGKDQNAKRAVDRIDQANFFEVDYSWLTNKLKIMYLQLVEQTLLVYNAYQSQQNVRSLSYDSIINMLKPRLARIRSYFYEKMKVSFPQVERPFNSFHAIESHIKDLLNNLKTIEVINR